MDGMNIADYIDPDIEELLDRLEAEEIEQLQELEAQMNVCIFLLSNLLKTNKQIIIISILFYFLRLMMMLN